MPLLSYPKLKTDIQYHHQLPFSQTHQNMSSITIPTSSSATSLATKLHIPPKTPSHRSIHPSRTNPNHGFKLQAKLGGEDGEVGKDGKKKKFITKEQEPEQYWQTAGEREGENPMKTPLPYIIIFGMSTPFIILAIGFLNGWIKVPIR